jgi:hypothetical protein
MHDLLSQLAAAGEALDEDREPAFAPARFPATGRIARYVIRRKAERAVAGGAEAAVARASSSSGTPLPADVRARFEGSLGADLSRVRVHTGPESAAAADAVGAMAYAVGDDIHFGAGRYAPHDPFGLHLLAHEVAHTVQQSGVAPVRQDKLEVSSPGDASELAADRAADAMVQGERVNDPLVETAPRVSRRPNDGAPQQPDVGTPPANGTPPPISPGGTPTTPSGTNAPGSDSGAGSQAPGTPAPQVAGPDANQNRPATEITTSADPQIPAATVPTGDPPEPRSFEAPPVDYQCDEPADIQAMLDQRADPRVQQIVGDFLARADTLRIDSLGYTYPPGLLDTLIASIAPYGPAMDILDQATTQNPYKGGDSWLDTAQSAIEAYRDMDRLLALDVNTSATIAGAIAAGAAAVGIFTGGLSEVVAAIAGALSMVGTSVKVVLDIVDELIGSLQLLILAIRVRNSDGDPAERARLLALMKRESGSIASDVTTAAMEVATIGVGALGGAACDADAEFGTAFTEQFKPIYNPEEAMEDAMKPLSSTAGKAAGLTGHIGEMDAQLGEANLKLYFNPASLVDGLDAIRLHGEIDEAEAELAEVNHDLAVALSTAKFTALSFGPVTNAGLAPAQGAISDSAGQTAKDKDKLPDAPPAEAELEGHDVSLSHVSAWPAMLQRMSAARPLIHAAQVRMKAQYDAARRDAGDEAWARVMTTFGGVQQNRNRIHTASLQEKAQAAAAEQHNADVAAHAGDAADKSNNAKTQHDGAKSTSQKALDVANTQIANFGGMKFTAMDLVDGGIGRKLLAKLLSTVQSQISDLVLNVAAHIAGVDPSELTNAQGDAQQSQGTETTSQAVAGQVGADTDVIQQQTDKLKEGLSESQQNAVQGMVQSERWIEALDSADQALALGIEQGNIYVQQVSRELAKEKAAKAASKADDSPGITAEYIAPILTGAAKLKAYLSGREDAMIAAGADALKEGFAPIQAFIENNAQVLGPVSLDAGWASGEALVASHVQDLDRSITACSQFADDRIDDAEALVAANSHDFDAAKAIAATLEANMDTFTASEKSAYQALGEDLKAGFGYYRSVILEHVAKEDKSKGINPTLTPGAAPPPDQK